MSNAKILVVDDEALITGLIQSALEPEGYSVSVANLPEDGLALVKKEHPDLILLDITMPRIDGYQFCQKMQEMGVMDDSAVIFLSGKTAEEDAGRSFALGAATFIRKPFNTANLREIVGLAVASLRGM